MGIQSLILQVFYYQIFFINIEYFYSYLVLFYIILVALLWRDFNYLNHLFVDVKQRTLNIKSKNLLKRIVLKTDTYLFTDITGFYVDDVNLFNKSNIRSAVYAKLEDSTSLILSDFKTRKEAEDIKSQLNKALHTFKLVSK